MTRITTPLGTHLGTGIGILLGGGTVALLSLLGALQPFDLPVGDLFLRLHSRVQAASGPADGPVTAVVLDDPSLEAFGPLPWPRDRLARLVETLFDQGARALALDLVLAEPGSEEGAAALAAALEGRPVALAAALREDGGWLLPSERFGGAARAAHAEGEVGPDGVVRTILATKQRAGIALPALSLAAARLVRPAIAISAGRPLHPDFRLPPGAVPRVSVLELARDEPRPDAPLAGSLVFLGTTATAASDQFLVPTGGGPAPGVLIHAAAAVSILAPEGDGLLRSPPPLGLVAACLLLAGFAQAARERSGRLRLAHFLTTGTLLLALGWLALAWLEMRLPLVSLAAAFGASALLREASESARAQRQTGRLLRALVAADDSVRPQGDPRAGRDERPTAPRGATRRLELARELQERVVRDRNLRRALLDSLEDGVIRWDDAGRVVLANAAATALWGGEPPARHEALEAAEGSAEPAEGSGDRDALVRRDGREIRLLVRPLDSHEGGGALGVLRDVTAERELESRRREMQRLVSHELKTPLASIASFGGMLERYRLSGDELDRVASLIRGESERLLEMVTTFLDLERIGGGRWGGERDPVDLAAFARKRREVLAAAAEEKGIELVVTGVEAAEAPNAGAGVEGDVRHPCQVLADPRLLARVIDNLVGNALKYSPAGGRVVIGVAPTGDTVELRVADQGPGIPPEALPRLFERFYRVPDSESDTAPAGTGLGLALVREIAEWHGGCVHVESEAGRGSVFTVRFPALDPASGSTRTPTTETTEPPGDGS